MNRMVLALAVSLVLIPMSAGARGTAPADAHLERAIELITEEKNVDAALAEFALAERKAPGDGHFSWQKALHLVRHAPVAYNDAALEAFAAARRKGFSSLEMFAPEALAWQRRRDHARAAATARQGVEAYLAEFTKASDEREARRAAKSARQAGDVLLQALIARSEFGAATEVGRTIEARVGEVGEVERFSKLTAQAHVWAGHEALERGALDEALAAYERAHEWSRRLDEEDRRKFDWGWAPSHLAKMVRRLKAQGRATPEYVHRVLAIDVARSEARLTSADGEPVEVSGRVDAALRTRWRLSENVVKRWVEAFSGGRFAVEFQRRSWDGVARPRENRAWLREEWVEPSLVGAKTGARVDSTLVHWTPGEAAWPSKTACRSADDRDLRRRLGPGASWTVVHDVWGVMLHEFMHVLECIEPAVVVHSAEQWAKYPGPEWTGAAEADYFAHHFATTLKGRWGELGFRRR